MSILEVSLVLIIYQDLPSPVTLQYSRLPYTVKSNCGLLQSLFVLFRRDREDIRARHGQLVAEYDDLLKSFQSALNANKVCKVIADFIEFPQLFFLLTYCRLSLLDLKMTLLKNLYFVMTWGTLVRRT